MKAATAVPAHRWKAAESQMDEEKFDRAEHQAKHRDKKKHHWKRPKSDERAVAVASQESSDGIREKARRIASINGVDRQQHSKMVQSRESRE